MHELDYVPKQKHWRISRTQGNVLDTNVFRHAAIGISFLDGDQYVVDPAGAQCGQYQAIVPFADYRQEYFEYLPNFRKFGRSAEMQKNILNGSIRDQLGPRFDFRVSFVQREVSKTMTFTVNGWEESHEKPLANVLNQKQAEFQKDRDDILDVVTKHMRLTVQWWEMPEGPKITYDEVRQGDGSVDVYYKVEDAKGSWPPEMDEMYEMMRRE